MSGEQLLAVAAMVQTVLLAWIAAWQARAAREARKANGHLETVAKRADERAEHVERLLEFGARERVDAAPSDHSV